MLELCKSFIDSRLWHAVHGDLMVARTHLHLADRSFSGSGPKLWNILPLRIQSITCKEILVLIRCLMIHFYASTTLDWCETHLRLFAQYHQTCEHDTLVTNEPNLLQIDVTVWSKEYDQLFWVGRSTRSVSHGARVRFGNLVEASFSSPSVT